MFGVIIHFQRRSQLFSALLLGIFGSLLLLPNIAVAVDSSQCLCQTRNSGTTTVRFFNGQPHSVTTRVNFPSSCKNAHVVTQSYTSWISCGNGSAPSGCLNNAGNSSTLVRSMVGNVTSSGFDAYLSADDTVWVGAVSPAYKIAYQYTCDDPQDAQCSCDATIRGGTVIADYSTGAQTSAAVPVALTSCSNPVVMTQTYRGSASCFFAPPATSCPNTPASTSTDVFSAMGALPTASGFSVKDVADDPVIAQGTFPIAHQTYCADHPDPAGKVFGGTTTVKFSEGAQNSSSRHISFPSNCSDPRVVTQSYTSNAACARDGKLGPCATNPANRYSYLQSFVHNVSSSGFDVQLSADDNIHETGDLTIGYQVHCKSTQCQDGIDNDGDGAVDFDAGESASQGQSGGGEIDFSCSGPNDDDETNPKAQCQDGIDNDKDGKVDLGDPGCRGSQDNDEKNPQCSDGVDNDNDGAVDYPNDFSCANLMDDDERNPLAQCQDGRDNDEDGKTDLNDPGCTGKQDNDEKNIVPQCSDGIDNDGDGATDYPSDFSCSSATDNDEASPAAQCQDGADNDGDGKIDLQDPGCTGKQDNDETDPPACSDGADNDADGKIDMSDPGCASPQDTSEDSDFLAAPANLQASDNNKAGIQVTWTTVASAVTYDLYRSEEPADTNPALFVKILTIASNSYFDTTAVPGRLYNYAVKAKNGDFSSAFSNVDAGLRPSDISGGDSDGDGVSDNQEIIDGTDPMDGGSFALHLKSPAFSKYNTYLSQQNFLELVGDGTLPVTDVRVTAYSLQGQPVSSTVLTIAAQTQIDLDVNAMAGKKDTYGVVKIEFKDDIDGATLKGRMSNYRPNASGQTYSFAFTKELRNPTRGDTYAGANSYDPQGLGFLVPNWMEVINLDSVDRAFVYSLYNQEGQLLQQQGFSLSPLAERDIQAGHEFGQGVYLGVIQPLDGESKYFAGVSRYSANSKEGSEAATYNYAFNLEARAGNGTSQYATIANEVGGCFNQSNWFEVANVRSIPVTATVSFRDGNGAAVGSSSILINPRAQYHFNAGALLTKGSYGSVKLDASLPGSLVAQSLVYFHDCGANGVQTAYAVQSRIAGQDVQTGSINSYIGMSNDLRLINSSTSLTSAAVTARPFASLQPLAPAQFNLNANGTLAVIANGVNAAFNFPENTYGTLKVQTAQPKQVVPYVLRSRLNPDHTGRMDFVIPVVVQ